MMAVKRLSIGAIALISISCTPGRAPSSAGPRADVLLITIDTLRADHATPELMPSLTSLAAQGLRFTSARTVAPLTLPAHTSLMTGLYPPRHGVRLNGAQGPAAETPTLARAFRAAGYDTAAFIGAFVLDRRFGLAEGFDRYNDRVPRRQAAMDRLEAERRGAVVVDAAIEWLTSAERKSDRPLFVWVHLYDPHAPYDAPAPAAARAGGQPYRGEVAYADEQVGRLLAALGSLKRADPIVVVVGDHGESLGEHGEPGHGMLLYEGAVRIPLVVAGPGVPHGQRDDPVSLVDVAPTVLARAGIAALADIDGHDLLGGHPSAEREVYGETEYPRLAGWAPLSMLVNARWKLLDASTPELYDLARDAGESSNVAPERPDALAAMQQRLAGVRARAAPSRPGALSAEADRRLRSLGYIASAPSPPASAQPVNPAAMMREWAAFEAALTRQADGDGVAALTVFAQLAKTYPESALFVTTWARAQAALGRHRDALVVFREATSRWPRDSALAHDRAVSAREAGLSVEALTAEQAALAIDPSNALAHNGLGLLLSDAGRYAEARAAFDRAAALDSTNTTYHVHAGNAARDSADPAGAEREYRAALALDEASVDALNGLGVMMVQAQKPQEAVPLLERAVALEPGFGEARLNLAIARQAAGDLAGARAGYAELLRWPERYPRQQAAARVLMADVVRRRSSH
jgi:arylsulfatase A-like enzyme/Flp pilus assembly protein TadD